MGYKAAVQVLKQAEDLKPKVLKKSDLLNDSEAWTHQQQLQNIYHQVLVLDLEYALDKKVEQDLWNIGFKNHITDLQEKSRDKKNPRRSDFQALLTWALESASGFYLTLLQELCNVFDIDLPFRRRGIVYGQSIVSNEQVNVPQIASCSYICQYCLVHLGDIARYRNQRKQAESFYMQAILVSPHSGHPYNQLALLEASQGDKLAAVFYYVRGICVKTPFPASSTNLMNVLSAAIDKESPLEKLQTKMTVNEYIHLFLCAHGHFHSTFDPKQARLVVQSLNSVMTALVATQSFKQQELIKITVINLYTYNYLTKEAELTKDETKMKELILELIAGSLSAFLMPVYTIQVDGGLLEYSALPAVKFLMYFLCNNPEILKCRIFKDRMQIWPSLCKLVNAAQSGLVGFNYNKYSKCSLQEDRDLQGFLPLDQNLKEFSFKAEIEDSGIESKVRIKRIIDFAKWLSTCDLDGIKLITMTEVKGILNFEPVLSQPDPTNDLLEEMKSFTFQESIETKVNSEKKAGILKPQGSLEKAREEKKNANDENVSENIQKNAESVRSRRAKQNVVLQSIFKKIEESKQVKFNVEETQEKEKFVKFDSSPKNPQQPPQLTSIQSTVQFNNTAHPPPPPPTSASQQAALHTQSFNQNHPAFPLQQPNYTTNDYLTNLRNLGKGADNMMPQFSKNSAFSNLNSQKVPGFPPPLNVPPPHFGTWGRDDTKLPPAGGSQNTWWGQNPPTAPHNLAFNQIYPNQNQVKPAPNYPPPPLPPSNQNQNYSAQGQDSTNYGMSHFPPQYNIPYQVKPPSNLQNQPPYDLFGSPWGLNRGPNFGNEDFVQSSISMRQAMLKEVNVTMGRMPASQQDINSQAPGYSLFNNASNWAPSLPNHMNSKAGDNSAPFNGPQHSLFGGPGPQSLAQLLEHQQNQMNPNMKSNSNQDT